MPEFICEICGKEKHYSPASCKGVNHHFCSRACHIIYMKQLSVRRKRYARSKLRQLWEDITQDTQSNDKP